MVLSTLRRPSREILHLVPSPKYSSNNLCTPNDEPSNPKLSDIRQTIPKSRDHSFRALSDKFAAERAVVGG